VKALPSATSPKVGNAFCDQYDTVADAIAACKSADDKLKLKKLHKIIYGRDGNKNEFRRNLRKFAGFNFGPDSQEYAAKVATVQKLFS